MEASKSMIHYPEPQYPVKNGRISGIRGLFDTDSYRGTTVF